MPKTPTLSLLPKQSQSYKQMQHLIMTHQMQQALHFLQLPIMELQPLIEAELEQNPILETSSTQDVDLESLRLDTQEPKEELEAPAEKELLFKENDFQVMRQLDEVFREHFAESGSMGIKKATADDEKRKAYLDSLICHEESLFEYLMRQARETFTPGDLPWAEALIGNFDEYGFLRTPLEEVAVLSKCNLKHLKKLLEVIQSFDPPGVGAASLQEALLIQLRLKNKQDSLAYRILEAHYDDLLHNRIPAIQEALKCTGEAIAKAIEFDISKLDVHPGTSWSHEPVPYIVPDASISYENQDPVVLVNEDPLPPLKLNPRYLQMLEDPALAAETKDFILKKIASAKWLLRNLTQRNETIVKISHALAKSQKEYLSDPNGKLLPMTMTELATELGLHESTIARAVANKYIDTPRGLLALRSFFSSSLVSKEGEGISSQTVRNEIKEIIRNEDKMKPLSDESIATLLESKGIPCARRTIAKYRGEMNLGNAQQRKKFSKRAD